MKAKSVFIILFIALVVVKISAWFNFRMNVNPSTACVVCGVNHYAAVNESAPLRQLPTVDEMLDVSREYLQNSDKCGFFSYVASLYRGDGTNYLPAIALSGWNDRAQLLDLESASEKLSRIQTFHIANEKYFSESYNDFFKGDGGLNTQIGWLNRDIYKDGAPSLRFMHEGGYRTTIRTAPLQLKQNRFESLQLFLSNVPPINLF